MLRTAPAATADTRVIEGEYAVVNPQVASLPRA
jgi:hypothetical protein